MGAVRPDLGLMLGLTLGEREVFGSIKKNLKIERALKLCATDLAMNPLQAIGGRTSPMASLWRAQMRQMDDVMEFSDQEMALTMAAPFAYVLRGSHLEISVLEKVKFWTSLGVVREDVAKNFVNELRYGSLEAE